MEFPHDEEEEVKLPPLFANEDINPSDKDEDDIKSAASVKTMRKTNKASFLFLGVPPTVAKHRPVRSQTSVRVTPPFYRFLEFNALGSPPPAPPWRRGGVSAVDS